jgi:hypothetical protein
MTCEKNCKVNVSGTTKERGENAHNTRAERSEVRPFFVPVSMGCNK